jgi:hypothetical protein
MITAAVCFVGMLALWLASAALLIRLRPEWVLEQGYDRFGNPVGGDAYVRLKRGRDYEATDPGVVMLVLAPLVLVFVLPMSMVARATMRSVNTKTSARAELEKELAAARKEIDDLLKREGVR